MTKTQQQPDRMVHAVVASEEFNWTCEFVRYDRAGKWYFEEDRNGRNIRTVMSVSDAAEHFIALRKSGGLTTTHYGGRRGGAAFDRLVKS